MTLPAKKNNLIPSRELNIDWTDLPAVIKLVNKLGPGQVVIKYSDRDNYNITHVEREANLPVDCKVVYRTVPK